MKFKTAFLAATAALASAGLFASGSASAAQQMISLSNDNDIALAKAIAEHSSVSLFTYVESGPMGMGPALAIGDGSLPTELSIRCDGIDPLAGVTDYSLLSRQENGLGGALSELNSLRLCSADVFDFDSLSQLTSMQSLELVDDIRHEDLFDLQAQVRAMPKMSLAGIEQMTNLRELVIGGYNIVDMQTIPQLPNLMYLGLNFAGLTNIDPLTSMDTLGYLSIEGNEISDMKPLLDVCVQRNICSEATWDSLVEETSLLSLVEHNNATYDTSSETVELPEYAKAYMRSEIKHAERMGVDIKKLYEESGLEYSVEDGTVKLDSNASEHRLILKSFFIPFDADTGEEWGDSTIYSVMLILDFNYTGQENPETSDNGQKNPETSDKSAGFAISAVAAFAALGLATFRAIKIRR